MNLAAQQHVMFLIFYALSFEILRTNSRTSTLWKLNFDKTKIIEASPFHQLVSFRDSQFITEDDQIFNILTSTVHLGNSWIKHGVEYYCANCHTFQANAEAGEKASTKNGTNDLEETLDCGKPVNFTYYDNLIGVLNRHRHPIVPDAQTGLFFRTKGTIKSGHLLDAEIDALERKLKRAKREKPKSVQLYNQIGNFWRIKGDTEKSMECFRRALAVSPQNAEVLLNLARVLFNLQYLDDAIYLTRRSLEFQPPDKSAWQQYFTLGEIFKMYGHYQEAAVHFKHALQLKPGFEPAEIALKDMETLPAPTVHVYTLIIIVFLVLGVLFVVLSTPDAIEEAECVDAKLQKHFNKTAVRSLRLSSYRAKKVNV